MLVMTMTFMRSLDALVLSSAGRAAGQAGHLRDTAAFGCDGPLCLPEELAHFGFPEGEYLLELRLNEEWVDEVASARKGST
jgi:hypothetical protein